MLTVNALLVHAIKVKSYKVGNGIKLQNSIYAPSWGVFMYVTPFAYQISFLVV